VTHGAVWTAGAPPAPGARLSVRIRHRHRPVEAWLASAAGDAAEVRFVESGPLVTPGQAAVFYRGELVVGGGWIAHELAAATRVTPEVGFCAEAR
jgi:tRNA-uridine 2-sulfurtransferase